MLPTGERLSARAHERRRKPLIRLVGRSRMGLRACRQEPTPRAGSDTWVTLTGMCLYETYALFLDPKLSSKLWTNEIDIDNMFVRSFAAISFLGKRRGLLPPQAPTQG
jgi:hypothetical protein